MKMLVLNIFIKLQIIKRSKNLKLKEKLSKLSSF